MRVYRYRLPLTEPIELAGRVLECREGLLLHRPELGTCGWSEAAPLPGWSREDLADLLEAVRSEQWHSVPSLSFAWQCLQQEVASSSSASRLSLNGLLMGNEAEVLARASELADHPFRSIKLKVGRKPSIETDVKLVQAVAERLRSDQRLRLDANRRWTWNEGLAFGQQLRPLASQIEYVEEPLQSPERLDEWASMTGLHYALDESFRETNDLSRHRSVAAIVLKPTLQPLTPAVLDQLTSSRVPLIFSACFESGVGLFHLARLAIRYAPDQCHGFDTYRWLAEDLLEPRWDLSAGQFDFHRLPSMRLDRLEEVRL